MKNFIEYSLPYRMTLNDHFYRILFTLLPMMLGVVLIMFLKVIGIALCAGLCYLAYRIFLSYDYELEYTLLENEIRFSKIINRERRRDLFTADISSTQEYGPIEKMPSKVSNVRSFLSNQGEEPSYYWITQNNKGENVCILFQPNEEVLEVFSVRARGKLR